MLPDYPRIGILPLLPFGIFGGGENQKTDSQVLTYSNERDPYYSLSHKWFKITIDHLCFQ